MPQAQTMTLDEKLALSGKLLELSEAGDKEGVSHLLPHEFPQEKPIDTLLKV